MVRHSRSSLTHPIPIPRSAAIYTSCWRDDGFVALPAAATLQQQTIKANRCRYHRRCCCRRRRRWPRRRRRRRRHHHRHHRRRSNLDEKR